MSDLVARLARAAAHGVRQKELVNEFLAGGPVAIVDVHVPGQFHPVKQYGSVRVGGGSWKNLRRRLTENGFFFTYSEDRRTVTMKFSA